MKFLIYALLRVFTAAIITVGAFGAVAQTEPEHTAFNSEDYPLHAAALNGNATKIFRLLIDGVSVNSLLPDGVTPLMVAAQHGKTEVAKVLLDAGAHKSAVTKNGRTAVMFAIQNGHDEVVRLLQLTNSGKKSVNGTVKYRRWTVEESRDKITGKFSAVALSNKTAPTRQLSFPYDDMEAYLAVGCTEKGDKDAWMIFSSLNSSDDSLRARWDDRVMNHDVSISGSEGVYFHHANTVINQMQKSTKVIIGIDLFRQGEVFFEWHLFGSNNAIKDALGRCANPNRASK